MVFTKKSVGIGVLLFALFFLTLYFCSSPVQAYSADSALGVIVRAIDRLTEVQERQANTLEKIQRQLERR